MRYSNDVRVYHVGWLAMNDALQLTIFATENRCTRQARVAEWRPAAG